MELDLLTAISPIDGRYRGKAEALADYFSEYALIKYRVQVEVEYFITLCELPLPQLKGIDKSVFEALRAIYRNFSETDAQRIKEIESVTNHDVKAVEYFLKEEFDKLGGLDEYKEFIHFGLTSQDINNTSIPLSIKEALEKVYYPQIEELIAQLKTYAAEWENIPMLAKTHGQPASPTRLGKEVMVFAYRMERQLATLKACPVTAKFGGATGNYNAHHVAYPEYDWKAFGNRFVAEKLGLERDEYTTQISNYDNLSAIFDAMKRINTIMIDMSRVIWQYISKEYFKQKNSPDAERVSVLVREVYEAAKGHKMLNDLGITEENDPGPEGFLPYIVPLHEYLSEVKDALVRSDLHVLGRVPKDTHFDETVYSLMRLDNGGVRSLRDAFAENEGVDIQKAIGDPAGSLPSGELNSEAVDRVDAALQDFLAWARGTGYAVPACLK